MDLAEEHNVICDYTKKRIAEYHKKVDSLWDDLVGDLQLRFGLDREVAVEYANNLS